jgi:hypothetical protein
MDSTIKQKIIARLLELAQPLRSSAGVRVIERKRTLFLVEPVKPAIHLVIGDETVVGEDTRGYVHEFPITFKIIMSDTRDAYNAVDGMVGFLQSQIESDPQLNDLAVVIKFDGELPFTEELLKPDGGSAVMYVIQYRRVKGDPYTRY